MKVFLGLLLLCVSCLPTFAQGYDSLSEYCEECLKDSVVPGYYEHPKRCDAYVHCQILNNSFIGHERFCGQGTCFNKAIMNCDYCSNVRCKGKCDSPTKFKDVFSCNSYFKCNTSGFNYIAETCPALHRFDEQSQSCVSDYRCSGPVSILPCSATFNLSNEAGKFWQRNGDSWVEKDCGPGTGFDIITCTCSKLTVVKDPICLLVDLPLKTNIQEISNNWFVENVGNVQIYDNAAQFTANSSLILPTLSNNDLSDSVEIQMRFMIKSALKDSFAIVSNGNCNRETTIGIKVENAASSPTLVGLMKVYGIESPVEIKTLVILNNWYSIKFGKSNKKIRMYLNNNLIEEKIISGSIETVASALSIGKPCTSNYFIGSVNEFKLSKCPTW